MFGLRHNGAFPLKGIFGRCCPSLSAVRGVASVGGPNGPFQTGACNGLARRSGGNR